MPEGEGAAPRLVFAGTPDFAVPCLRACLASAFSVAAVYTQPDRRSGRGRKLHPSPVKRLALDAGVAVEQPLNFKSAATRARLAAWQPALLVVVAYGLILPQAVLDIPRLGGWNVHASLLPRWRGAAPIQRAIAAGDRQTGVALMQMQAGLDTGPVLLQKTTPIDVADTGGSLHDRLAELGAEVLAEGLAAAWSGKLPQPTPQPDQGVTYAHKLDKREAVLDLTRPAAELERSVRAFNPWPIAETVVDGQRLRIHAARAVASAGTAEPGRVVAATPDGMDIACGEGALRLTRVQREGGRPVAIADYLNVRRG